jgi:hypothetical protein
MSDQHSKKDTILSKPVSKPRVMPIKNSQMSNVKKKGKFRRMGSRKVKPNKLELKKGSSIE